MKLAQLQEAKYYIANYVDWIEQTEPEEILSSDGKYQGSQLQNVPVKTAKRQLTDEYGEPQYHDRDAYENQLTEPYYEWREPNITITLFPNTKTLKYVQYIKHPIF